MTYKELYKICHAEAVAYANSERWSKRNAEQKAYLIEGYLDAMMEMRKSEITEKKKEYPKTYDECIMLALQGVGYNRACLLVKLEKLLTCRDAYWKIAGEEMGLDKPWEPDLTDNVTKHCIEFRDCGVCKVTYSYTSRIFAFPTAEMRDAFYENFKEEIEQCKELL